ncbi:DEAD box ATP-dependent RNA helicase, putative [Ixodes scapularis]|uniref:RNA helicase n=1 Tax=Ixodes scapularis TaxID=6945 RepID=B7PEL1_IXOSC|nr:DEAD box ATP-dependent RNA helicase, putative [Ixodes scapularis]|eukprot:XP_002433633.1 DEAD box ATP-dependent RNA helicase, putative [Ixodes scapularis]
MNTSDFFKKLCVGVNFNVSKFRPDAERFKLVKKTEDKSSEPRDGSPDSSKDHANGPGVSKSGVKRKKPGSADINENETTTNQANPTRACKRQRIRAKGTDVPELLSSFEELAPRYKLSQTLLRNIASLGYKEPTAVQRQAIPAMLERRELLCCAPTGSGKTAAFLVPIIGQLQRQQSGKTKGDGQSAGGGGFRALVLSPTRELARQTYRECLQLVRDTGLKVYLLSKLASARTRLASAQHKLA